MPRKYLAILISVAAATCMLPLSASAAWEWPSRMEIGGFTVTDIRGSVNSDGSGSASGSLQIPRAGGERISLTRSSGGEVKGSGSIDTRTGGVNVEGRFTLDNSGLRGRGTLKTSPKPIVDASIRVSESGEFSGDGRVELGRASMNVRFSLSGSLDVSGSTQVRAQEDTPLATYRFDGRLSLEGRGSRIEGAASGSVHRTGKLADQSTTYQVSDASVNLSNGSCTVNAGGVSVTFRLF